MRQANVILFALWGLAITACGESPPEPPVADKQPMQLEMHDDVRIDDYYWLNERDNPAVIRYLEQENAYADSIISNYAGLQERLIEEMAARMPQQDMSAPYRLGDYFYYKRFEAGQEYPVYCRRKGSMDAPEEVLLDVNTEAAGEAYFSVQGVKVSPDQRTLAYAVDTVGRRLYEIRFVDLETGDTLAERIANVTSNFVWAADSTNLFYVRQDPQTLRWQEVYRHELGSSAAPTLVFEEPDETFGAYLYKSVDGAFVFILSQSTLATEVLYVPAAAPDTPPQVFLARQDGHEYFVQAGGDRFFVLSNDGAENFQLLQAPLDDTSREAWQVVLPHRDDVLLETFTVLDGFIAVEELSNGLSQIEVIDRESGETYAIDFGEETYSASIAENYEYGAARLRYDYESLTTPESVYEYDLENRTGTLIKEEAVVGDFDRDDYVAERRFATARDGTKVPVSLVYRKGLEMNGENPLLQYAYGSYGYSVDPGFDANRLSLLDRGFIFAIAHIRGGSEMGRQWYYDGRQLNKKNTFYDFIDVSKFLIAEGYTSPGHLYARGGSAGGLLMGAVVNMAPELYRGVTTRVPFVDVVTTMLDPSIPLTTSEYDEWGNPNIKEYYDYMLSYSPYDQVSEQDYPNMLVTTSLHDSQVQYWEPAKWVARLRDYKTDDNILIMKTDMQAGHSGKTGRFQSLEDDALYYAFFLYLEGAYEQD